LVQGPVFISLFHEQANTGLTLALRPNSMPERCKPQLATRTLLQ
jgi:hypothetical protein